MRRRAKVVGEIPAEGVKMRKKRSKAIPKFGPEARAYVFWNPPVIEKDLAGNDRVRAGTGKWKASLPVEIVETGITRPIDIPTWRALGPYSNLDIAQQLARDMNRGKNVPAGADLLKNCERPEKPEVSEDGLTGDMFGEGQDYSLTPSETSAGRRRRR